MQAFGRAAPRVPWARVGTWSLVLAVAVIGAVWNLPTIVAAWPFSEGRPVGTAVPEAPVLVADGAPTFALDRDAEAVPWAMALRQPAVDEAMAEAIYQSAAQRQCSGLAAPNRDTGSWCSGAI